ncbi:MAG: ring-cleaving dioxygenase [Sulfobacillus sp.]
MRLTGIHHVSALTAQARANLAFYTGVMGMRLVKKTVNQDDTSSYHLFYGDQTGSPGTELTFFDIPQAAANRPGNRSISSIGLTVRDGAALDYWQARLAEWDVDQDPIVTVAGRSILAMRDPEGQRLILTADDKVAHPHTPWQQSPVPAQTAILGLGPITLTVPDGKDTVAVLTELMGFEEVLPLRSDLGQGDWRRVFSTGEGAGAEIHLEIRPQLPAERLGRGGTHHVAFRVPDEEQHRAWLDLLERAGLRTSGLVDRYYFRSIYFREPSGILFELATDGPGFLTDEDAAHLGERLALPPFLEPRRAEIEAGLSPLELPR